MTYRRERTEVSQTLVPRSWATTSEGRLFIGDKHKQGDREGDALSPSWTPWLMTSNRWRPQLDNEKWRAPV